MAQPQRERYVLLKVLLGIGSVVGVMLAWLGFARSSDARIEAWEIAQQAEVAVVATTSQPTATVAAPSSAAGSAPTTTATSEPLADSWPTPRARVSRGS